MRTSLRSKPGHRRCRVRSIGRPLALFGLVALAVMLLIGCGGTTTEDLYGEWKTGGGTTITLDEDETWGAQHSLYGPEPFDWGTFTFDGETLTFFTAAGGLSCQEGQTGVYEATVSGDRLEMDQIEEPCSGRAQDFRNGMTRKAS